MENLILSIIQSNIHWHNKAANLKMFESNIRTILKQSDIIILPEMFNTGFSMDAEQLHESMDGQTIQWMQNMADRTQSAIVGSLIIKEMNHYFNRLIWAWPDGSLNTYDKRHLFSMADEQKYFTAGK